MKYDPSKVPPEIGYYLAGFADGEGSFNFSFRRRNDYKSGWKISACFNVSNKDKLILTIFQRYFECGTLRSRPDDVWYYEVNDMQLLLDHVIPFFQRFGFLSAKKKNDFAKFCQIIDILIRNNPRTKECVEEILHLRNQMNGGGKRKFSDEIILSELAG